MFCTNCGAQNEDSNNYCSQCGKPLAPGVTESDQAYYATVQYQNVETYLVGSILVTIFCCLPFGIPAIVYSAIAESKKSSGDFEGARRAASVARMWLHATLVLGLLFIFFQLGLVAFA
ncbi:CD225/dispanin family protein [bacterium]|nr:CD225/dispanin family protein [bacterium]